MSELNPYAPYPGLEELLQAAGVPASDVYDWSTEALLDRARQRAAVKATKETHGVPRPRQSMGDLSIGPFTTRTIRIPIWLLEAVEVKAKAAGTSLNGVAGRGLRAYVSEVKPPPVHPTK